MDEVCDRMIIGMVEGIVIGMMLLAIILGATTNGYKNLNVDIGLSQESADLVCQKITNNPNTIAIDWSSEMDEPKNSLICEIKNERIDGGLIQIFPDSV